MSAKRGSCFKISFLYLIILFICFLINGCGSAGNTKKTFSGNTVNTLKTSDSNNEDKPVVTPTPETPAGSNNDGFTLPTEGLRPYAVMIDNEGTKSLPQGGLDKAQVIYEIIVEGGETRLMPVFWGTMPEMIGPVRSSRHYFINYVMEHDAIYVHFGWSPMAQRDISKYKINNINGVANGGEVFRDITSDRKNWQDSYTSMQKVRAYVAKKGYRTSTDKKLVFTYSKTDVIPESSRSAVKIKIKYSYGYNYGYEYDSLSGLYKRYRKGLPQMERVSGKQLEAKNIIIQYVANNAIKGDNKGRQDVKTVGSGSGFFISCGKAVKIKWSKDARTSQTKYTDESGNRIILNPGQTWVQILPLYSKVQIN